MKKIVCLCIVILMLLYFIFFPKDALDASRQGLILWFEQILPTLLPFSILSYIVLKSNIFAMCKNSSRNRISAEEWYVILCGFLFGFPIGSKLTADLYRQNHITKEHAQILCVFTNNLSPLFVIAVLQEILHLKAYASFYILLYGIPFIYGIIGLAKTNSPLLYKQKNTASRFQMNMQIVDAGIINGFETLLKICGYIMMFSILTQMLRSVPWKHSLFPLLLTGCMEVTNGISLLGESDVPIRLKYLLSLLFLSLNGICGLFQTASILSDTGLSMRNYCKHKLRIILFEITGTVLLFFLC